LASSLVDQSVQMSPSIDILSYIAINLRAVSYFIIHLVYNILKLNVATELFK